MSILRTAVATLALALGSTATFADPAPAPSPGGPHKPPQAAFDACAKSRSGDACSFVGHMGKTRSGTCVTPKDGGSALVCHGAMGKPGAGSGSGTP